MTKWTLEHSSMTLQYISLYIYVCCGSKLLCEMTYRGLPSDLGVSRSDRKDMAEGDDTFHYFKYTQECEPWHSLACVCF